MNKNCLAGIQCPECLSDGPFVIEVSSTVLMSDDGWDENVSDTYWNDSSYCRCDKCDHVGIVSDFKQQTNENIQS
tara:strand:+ start:278 stop:502 length:225 start_codon:yes stop_codon:yes gene_type:complete